MALIASSFTVCLICFVFAAAQMKPPQLSLKKLELCYSGEGPIKISNFDYKISNDVVTATGDAELPVPVDEKFSVEAVFAKRMGNKWNDNFLKMNVKGCNDIQAKSGNLLGQGFKVAGAASDQCNFPKGKYGVKDYQVDLSKIKLPPMTPKGDYKVTLKAKDETGKELGCYRANVMVK